jgi:MarR family transcriptional regulator, organic hydroperoxide resistance regulator
MPRITRDEVISDTVQALRRVFKAIQDYSQDVSDRLGITGPQLWALKTVFQTDGLSQTELSKKMYLHPSTVSGVVDRLENKGYVVRDRGIQDRRVIKVRLTAEGKNLAKKAPNPAQGKLIHGLRKLKKAELEIVHNSVQKLVEIVEAENVKATFFFDEE